MGRGADFRGVEIQIRNANISNIYHPKIDLHTKFYPNWTLETCSNPGEEAEFRERGFELDTN